MTSNVIGELSQEEISVSSNKEQRLKNSLEFTLMLGGFVSMCSTHFIVMFTKPTQFLIELGYVSMCLGITLMILGISKWKQKKYELISLSGAFIFSGMYYVILGWEQNIDFTQLRSNYEEYFVVSVVIINWLSLFLVLIPFFYMFKLIKRFCNIKHIEKIHNFFLILLIIIYSISFSNELLKVAVNLGK